jgi:hypothetical protein
VCVDVLASQAKCVCVCVSWLGRKVCVCGHSPCVVSRRRRLLFFKKLNSSSPPVSREREGGLKKTVVCAVKDGLKLKSVRDGSPGAPKKLNAPKKAE